MMITQARREGMASELGRQARTIAGREIYFDHEGFFWDPNDWSEEVAQILARESGLDEMTEIHWKLLDFFRTCYRVRGSAPLNRELKECMNMSLREIELLFPGGIRLGARRLAGMPNPKSCI